MKKIFLFVGIAAAAFLTSCEKEYEADTIAGYEMSGQWYVQTYFGTPDPANIVLGYEEIVTSNTAAATGNEILIDDLGHIWPFVVKVPANPGSLTFGGSGLTNLSVDTTTVTISNGQVFPNGGRSTSGIVVDSIYMEAEFSDDPGNTYIFAGHYRTGFTEDEH